MRESGRFAKKRFVAITILKRTSGIIEARLGIEMKYKFGGDKPMRERIHITGVKDDATGYWVRLQAANSPIGTRPILCIMDGDCLIIEETEQ